MKKWIVPDINMLDVNETASGGKADRYEGDQGLYGKEKAPNGKPYHPHGDFQVVDSNDEGEPAVDAKS